MNEELKAMPEPALTVRDVYTLIGHAEYLRRVEGQTDMPAYFMDLAGRIATAIGDQHMIAAIRESAGKG